ncbi:MAG: isocitrate lyase/phosphoenolpyruvate mutase family protein [Methyloligellaceae bacterium]
MIDNSEISQADLLKAKLRDSSFWILPEVWDVASARVYSDLGFDVISTSAAGIGWAQGYKDQEAISAEELLLVATRILRTIGTTIIADLEGGLNCEVGHLKRMVHAALSLRLSGISFSDGSRSGSGEVLPTDQMCNLIKAAHFTMASCGRSVPLVIRSGVNLSKSRQEDGDQALSNRIRRYRDAGADRVFFNEPVSPTTIRDLSFELKKDIGISLQALGEQKLRDYEAFGISCLALGPQMVRRAQADLQRNARALRAQLQPVPALMNDGTDQVHA